jgi:hypothetical protein
VASRTLREPLPWPSSSLLGDDVPAAVAELRSRPGADLLMIHPLALGSGRRLFAHGGPRAGLRLVESTPSTTGVLIATYRPA